jgi:HD-GYP domain-containing protein (c-di-GMP phosphodiesterase class II)
MLDIAGAKYIGVPLPSLRIDTSPPFNLYFRPGPNQPLVLYCERHVHFTEKAHRVLTENRIDTLYVSQGQYEEYKRYLADHLQDALVDGRISLGSKAEILHLAAVGAVDHVLDEPDQESVREGRQIVRQAVDFITRRDVLLQDVLHAISGTYYLSAHSVNTMAYAVALAMRCGFRDGGSLREMASGALLHDIGMGHLDPAIHDVQAKLSPDQWIQVKQHPVVGHDTLEKTGALGEIALDIILHHHEKSNGAGYPHGLGGDEISPLVRIVSIADVFDALTTERTHRPAYSTFNALILMRDELRDSFDPDFLRAFIEMMGLRR